jgi:hypothetical protein
MCLHNDQGAMGLVINRVAPMSTGELLRQVGIEPDSEHDTGQPVMIGGPVSVEHGILLYRAAADDPVGDEEISIADDLRLCPNQSFSSKSLQEMVRPFFTSFSATRGGPPANSSRRSRRVPGYPLSCGSTSSSTRLSRSAGRAHSERRAHTRSPRRVSPQS